MSRPPVNPEDPNENPREAPNEIPSENPAENPRGNDGEHPGENSLRNPDRAAAGNPVRPKGIIVIAVVVALEAAALLVAGGWYGMQLLTGAPVLSFWGAVFTLCLLLAFSAWLFAVARFLLRGFRWPRAGALVAQLFVLTIGFPTLTGGYPVAGLAMLIPAVTAIVLLFDKRVIAFASRAAGAPPAL
ncbi:hypothetical protein ACFRJ8_07490 [Arthrobacter sp. NPDC056886]|uniref:hypothetical protein n=1 Tax=Arthrobacter sp. NPDC056886 TaxID=3345960 RepID=UPI003672548D